MQDWVQGMAIHLSDAENYRVAVTKPNCLLNIMQDWVQEKKIPPGEAGNARVNVTYPIALKLNTG